MKKKIKISQLKPGMYVTATDQSWFYLPFFSKKIRDQVTIDKLKASGVQAVTIDTEKGDDVADGIGEPEAQPAKDLFHSPEWVTESLNRSQAAHERVLEKTRTLLEKVREGGEISSTDADEQVTLLLDQIMNDPQSMLCVSVLKNKDEFTFSHCVNTSILALFVGKSLGVPAAQLLILGKGMLFHDIGKCMIPNEVLTKPTSLTTEEAALIKTHVEKGVRYLQKIKGVEPEVLEIVANHHERMDGSGYPKGLRGDAIGRFGSIAAVLDVYDALIHENYYKASKDPGGVLRKMREGVGVLYDERALKALTDCLGVYPPGSLLMLDSGEMAVSWEPNPHNPYRPRVLLLTRPDGTHYDKATPVHLAEPVLGLKKYKRSILTTMSLEESSINPFEILGKYTLANKEAD